MKSKENIVFLGMMGSGKSSIGSLVSKKLQLDFFDIDTCIENELGMNIPKIFETKGEKFFRNFEEKITLKILKKSKIVIALGGGAFLNKNVQNEILMHHFSFWLKWRQETIIKRVKNSSKRPIASRATNAELVDLIKKRAIIYSKALYKVNCDGLTKNEILKKIIKNL
jgi:shikimate kinase